MFRRVDDAYILADFSDLHASKGDRDLSWKTLLESTEEALATNQLPLALDNQELLAGELEANGYDSLAFRWLGEALKTVRMLFQKEIPETLLQELRKRELALAESQVELALRLIPRLPD